MKNKWIQYSGGVAMMILLLAPFLVWGDEPIVGLEVAIGTKAKVSGLVDYIIEVYEFIIGTIGIVATVVIMYWGFRWITAAGNQTIIGNAKEGIQSALIGVVIALLSYSILQFLNPSFVALRAVDVPQVELPEAVIAETPAQTNFTAVNCEEVGTNFMESLPDNLKSHLNFASSSQPCLVGASYTALVNALQQLDDPNSPYYGMKLQISSAYRLRAAQQHLWNCYQVDVQDDYRDDDDSNGRRDSCRPYYTNSAGEFYFKNKDGSGYTIQNVKTYTPAAADMNTSDVASSCSGCNTAAIPGTSKHESGYAIDVSWLPDSTITNPNASYVSLTGNINETWHNNCAVDGNCSAGERESLLKFDKFLQESGFHRICIEWWHYETSDTTGSWCSVGEYRRKRS